jgi:hypothetical protein
LSFRPEGSVAEFPIADGTRISYNERLADWQVGPIRPGPGNLKLQVFTESGAYHDSVDVVIRTLIGEGYPAEVYTRPSLFTISGDIDGDSYPELISGGDTAIIVHHYNENRTELLHPDRDVNYRSAFALHDFDDDGDDELVTVSDEWVGVINGNGEFLPGWPHQLNTGLLYNAYPTPLIADIDNDGTMEILVVTQSADVYCWRADGMPYFRTTDGLFSRLSGEGYYRVFGGSYVPFTFAHDFNSDGYLDVGVLYPTGSSLDGGLFMLSGKNGQALYPDRGKLVRPIEDIFGGLLADFDKDGVPEIAFPHWFGGNDFLMGVTICESDGTLMRGWPQLFHDKSQWLSAYPAAADLDGDSLPELICVFSALDGGELYVWHGDGTPYLETEFGRNDGILATVTTSLAPPLVFDIDADDEMEIIARGGALFWGKYERVYSWELDGTLTHRWPSYTYADPDKVFYSPYCPLAGDFDLDGKLEMVMNGSDGKLYSWPLETPAEPDAILWGGFLRDNRRTGIYPFSAKETVPPEPEVLPSQFRLSQNYPNPFNGRTQIEVELPQPTEITLDIFNILGQRITVLSDHFLPAGSYRFSWDGTSADGDQVASGIYLYRLVAGEQTLTRKMLYLK